MLGKKQFYVLFFISNVAPEGVMFWPWTERAYSSTKPFMADSACPNEETVLVTFWRFVEDIAMLALLISDLVITGHDVFTWVIFGITVATLLLPSRLASMVRVVQCFGRTDFQARSEIPDLMATLQEANERFKVRSN